MQDVPVGVSGSFHSHKLVVDTIFFSFFELLIILLYNFPSLVLPLQHLQSFSLQLRLSPLLLILPPHSLVLSKIMLKTLQSWITWNVPSKWWVGASSACSKEAAPVPSTSNKWYYACGRPECGLLLDFLGVDCIGCTLLLLLVGYLRVYLIKLCSAKTKSDVSTPNN